MTQLDAQELTLLKAFEAGQLASVTTESQLHALRAAAPAAMADRRLVAAYVDQKKVRVKGVKIVFEIAGGEE